DHHGIALVGSLKEPATSAELNHLALEVATLDEVVRVHDHLPRHGTEIDCAGRRRAAVRLRSNFATRTITGWKSTGASIRSAAMGMSVRRASGRAREAWPTRSPTRCVARTRRCTIHHRSKAKQPSSLSALSNVPCTAGTITDC